ncbi:hypothetical protein [Pseudomonas chlororaphis]|uniref:hypothetical protein n=1 Tax=Pseudomonas chlororaphis TaxID=587753 RepID=UPI000F5814A2|nr:hypothetical protein [Pseudomonas chlororaphis]WDG71918.1 hypothetical protein PUP65_28100 [Pseudomonas chlororaphis]WDH30298.1 hypothetical protein PUP81_06220 [Pseudomonas chlororaphis]WDH70439.1 hypothetical protein PUP78_28055 [Pseudomonas chlororaphis]
MVDTAKNNLRILVVDSWSFQLMETLSTLGQAGYFNTFPALSCLEALIALIASRRPYDVILFSTKLNITELNMLIFEISIRKLARYFLLIGDSQPSSLCLDSLYEANRPECRCLGMLNKPLSPDKLAATLARIPVRNRHKINTPMFDLSEETNAPSRSSTPQNKDKKTKP